MKYAITLLVLLATGCAARKITDMQTRAFVEFQNNNKIGMNLDGTIIKDKDFKLQIPKGLVQIRNSISNCFTHTLSFDKSQQIVLLYFPGKASILSDFESSDLTYKEFEKLCEKEQIVEELQEIKKERGRHFGLRTIMRGSFYVMYLNVQTNNVSSFNHSINSVLF